MSTFVEWSVARARILFNRADFWGSHEALEPAWRRLGGNDKTVIQGLIQASAAFHKLVVQDNPQGAESLLQRSLQRLAAAPDGHFGVALGSFRAELEIWRTKLAEPAAIAEAGPIVGLPRLEWSIEANANRMVVDGIRLYEIEVGGRRAVLVSLRSGGTVGWGECSSGWGTYGLWASLVEGVSPALLTEPLSAPSEAGLLWTGVTETSSAITGVEFALWDLWAQQRGVPLCEAFGYPARGVRLSGRVPTGDVALVGDALARLVAAGFQHVIVPARPNTDRRVLPALLSGATLPFAIDLGGAYRLADIQALQVLDELQPSYLIQPVPPCSVAHASRLRRYLNTRLSMGDWTDVEAVENAIELEACDILHVDSSLLGPTGTLVVAESARYLSRPLWVKSTAITEVGARGDLALAAHPAVSEPCDLSRGADELGRPAIVPDTNGEATPSPDRGLGYAPDAEWLDSVTSRHMEMRA